MTLHQLTQTVPFEFGLPASDMLRRLAARLERVLEARRQERELALLDHREISDLAFRR